MKEKKERPCETCFHREACYNADTEGTVFDDIDETGTCELYLNADRVIIRD